MNNLKAIAHIKEHRIDLVYTYNDIPYIIELPRTDLNQGMEEGETVHVQIGVMPIEGGKPNFHAQEIRTNPMSYDEE